MSTGRAALAAAILAAVALSGPPTAPAAPSTFQLIQDGIGLGGPDAERIGPFPDDVAVDADGNVWVVDGTGSRILKYTYTGEFVTAIGAPALNDPRGIGTDAAGSVYVADVGLRRVVRFTTGGDVAQIIGADEGPERLGAPADVAVDNSDGRIYVTDGNVTRFNRDGSALGPLGEATGSAQIAVATDGEVDVLEGGQIRRWSREGTLIGSIDPAAASFTSTPGGVAVDPDGDIYVAFNGEGTIGRFDRAGSLVQRIGAGVPDGELGAPAAVAVDCRRNAYVADTVAIEGVNRGKLVKYGDPASPPPPCEPPRAPPGAVDVRVDDIEVTQGIQPVRSFLRLSDFRLYDEPGGGLFPGDPEVPLRIGGRTVVRVFASLRSGPPGGIANIPATLEARAGGQVLEPVALAPDTGPSVIRVGDGLVDLARRQIPAGAYTFTLPPEWTRHRRIDLTARVNPAGIGCDEACRDRATFTVRQVKFQPTFRSIEGGGRRATDVIVYPVALTINGRQATDSPIPQFDFARAVTPQDLLVFGWAGNVEVGDIVNIGSFVTEECTTFLGIDIDCETTVQQATRDDLEYNIFNRLAHFKRTLDIDNRRIVFGLIEDARMGKLPGASQGALAEGSGPLAYAIFDRETTVAHEIQHAFGRSHASSCGGGNANGQKGEPWPPDEQGFLQGIGLDTRPGSGGGRGPYRIIPAGAEQAYDLMSYCRDRGPNWISPRGWRAVINYKAPAQAARARAVAQDARRVLRVTAIEYPDGRLAILGVSPGTGRAPAGDPSSPYRVEARDGQNRVLSTVAVTAAPPADGGQARLITADVPAPAGTEQVLVHNGLRGARRRRSPNAPTVRLLTPRTRARAAGPGVLVSWRAHDRDASDRLTAAIEFSPDGRRWRIVHVGPARGRVRLPVRLLTGSRRARLRLRVEDGFNEDVATSGRFTVVGARPLLRIVEPRPGRTIRADGRLHLSADATGDGGVPLVRRAFTWYDGRRRLGRGTPLSVGAPAAGRHRIRVVAGRKGRRATRTVVVRVTAVRPAFLRLDAPQRISPRARSLRLRVASTVAATLSIGSRRFEVGRATTNLRVPVRRGRTQLRLALRLQAGRFTTRQSVVVERR